MEACYRCQEKLFNRNLNGSNICQQCYSTLVTGKDVCLLTEENDIEQTKYPPIYQFYHISGWRYANCSSSCSLETKQIRAFSMNSD